MSMNETVHTALSAIILLVLAGVVVYGFALLAALFGGEQTLGGKIRRAIEANPDLGLGVPCAGIAAIAIVAAMLKAFQSDAENTGNLSFTAFDMQFSGPSGPVTLWVICFLSIVAAIRLLRR
ncbi:MAG: hypothetical protein IPK97_20590 [Ahniella sp.]|nr:hypothetical protein [Ahniella sp.]